MIVRRYGPISFNDLSAIVAALNSLNILWNQSLRFNSLSAGRQLARDAHPRRRGDAHQYHAHRPPPPRVRTIMTVVVATHGPACDGAITIPVNRHLAGVSTTLVIQGLSGSERWTTGGSAMIDTGNRARTRAHPFLA